MERLTLRDDDGRALLTPYGLRIYCSTQATADCICKLEEALQAQEPVEPKMVAGVAEIYKDILVGNCPSCGQTVVSNVKKPTKYCRFCGQAVKWE